LLLAEDIHLLDAGRDPDGLVRRKTEAGFNPGVKGSKSRPRDHVLDLMD
jgi:hypothetical protein